MNAEQEDFNSLRKMLALKKYEQPPPRYFSELPGRIWNQIEREKATTPFWNRLFPQMAFPPALGYSFGLMAFCTLFLGVLYSLRIESETSLSQSVASHGWPHGSPQFAGAQEASAVSTLVNFQPQGNSTNPVMSAQSLPSIFDKINIEAAPVSYSP